MSSDADGMTSTMCLLTSGYT